MGQARAFGRQADPALVKGLKQILEKRRNPEPFSPPEQVNKQLTDLVAAFLVAAKNEKTALDLTAAIVEATAGERFDPQTVIFLDLIVSQSMVGLKVIELRFLKQLALRAARPDDWNDESMKMIWDTVILAEEVSNRPSTLYWARTLLDQADAQRHEAMVLLLPQAHGYATQRQVTEAWQLTNQLYAFIDACQHRLRLAQDALDRARSTLVAYVPYLEATGRVERETLWLQAAKTAQDLDALLKVPESSSDRSSLTSERLVQRNGELADRTQKLEFQLKELLRPFQPEAIQSIARKSQANRPDPELASDVEAILTTPFPTAQDRAKLWRTSLALDRRLGELTVRDSDPNTESAPDRDRAIVVRERVGRRFERLSALIALAGVESSPKNAAAAAGFGTEVNAATRSGHGSEAKSELDAIAQLWGGLARYSEFVHKTIIDLGNQPERPDSDDRPGWMARAFTLDLTANPIRQYRDRDSSAGWAWLADHYRQESSDLREFVDPDRFYANADLECRREVQAKTEPTLDLRLADNSAASPSLSARNTKAEVPIRLILTGGDSSATQEVRLKVLDPADTRLRIVTAPPAKVDLSSQREGLASFQVEWIEADTRAAGPPPKGLIVQARLSNERRYHLLVPLNIVSETSRPRLVLSTDVDQSIDVPFERLLLRTLPNRQNYHVFIRNPSANAFDVVVEIVQGSKVLATSGPSALAVKGRSTVAVPSFSAPVAPAPPGSPAVPPVGPVIKDTDPLPEVPQRLKLRLRDAVTTDQIYEEQPLQPAIAAPLEYLEVIQPQFTPARAGETNRLEVTLRALPQMNKPPCRVKLIVPPDKEIFPAFLEPPKGALEGDLVPGGAKLFLRAEDIKLDPHEKEEGRFQLTIDGLERVLWYKTQFPAAGEPQIAFEDQDPRVRFNPKLEVKPGQNAKLIVQFMVDNVPSDARLHFRLGQIKGGQLVDEITPVDEPAKRQHLGFNPTAAGGVLQFEASVSDWSNEFDVPQLRGPKRLEATLIDARTRKELHRYRLDMILDDLPPQNASIVDFPEKLAKGTARLAVKATVKVPESGIKEVAFILGPKADFAKPDVDGKIVQGKRKQDDPNIWEGMLAVPKDASGKLVVTARFTSGVGLTSLASEVAEILEPPPTADEAAAKPAPEMPGGIEGKVTENDIAQPGLEVSLWDPKAKDAESQFKNKTTTKTDGSYAFTDLKPGLYRVFCKKEATGRQDIKDVTVPSGKTIKRDLDLLR